MARTPRRSPSGRRRRIVKPPTNNYREQFGVIVICADEREQKRVFDRLSGQGLRVRVVTT